MLQILSQPVFRRLFTAQVVALMGTGLLTIALGLLAFDLAGDQAGQVLGLALTIKMVAYVGVSPIMAALLEKADRRTVLICADIVRASVAMCLPFVDAAWHIYGLIFVLQAASATFTPTFQAVIPDVLLKEEDYTRGLSLSRLAHDIENVLSPVLAGVLLAFLAPSMLFVGTAIGFVASAWLILATPLPDRRAAKDRPFWQRVTRGSRIYLSTPRLRGLLALNVVVTAAGSVVIVQSVVVAQSIYGGSEQALAALLGAYGFGSMAVALLLPRLLDTITDRAVMFFAGWSLAVLMLGIGLTVTIFGWPSWVSLLGIWCALGAANTAILTPSGRLLRRSAHQEDRPAVFAAQFALSHACWLFAYPAAGFLGSAIGINWTMSVMGATALVFMMVALRVWRNVAPSEIEHTHQDLPPDHPHLRDAVRKDGVWVHRHRFIIDDEHRVWPTSG